MTPHPQSKYLQITEKELLTLVECASQKEPNILACNTAFCITERAKNSNAIPATTEREKVFPSSTDLLLIAHDEWKRREERRHIHEELPWIHGWISGYLTSRKFVNDRIEKLRQGEQR